MENIIYVGIDVHKDTNTVCLYEKEENTVYEVGKIPAGTDDLLNALKKAQSAYFPDRAAITWKAGYEAGPTGYGQDISRRYHEGLEEKRQTAGAM